MSKISGIKRLHFIGAGGISMSALAKLMILWGKEVSGSDLVYSDELSTLNQWGAEIWAGHDPIKACKAELVVYNSAIPDDDPELKAAREANIPCVVRHHFLQEVSRDYDTVIAVSGTHGKTTTTGLIASIFRRAREAFTAHIGGNLNDGGNLIFRGYNYFITEACEYKKSLLSLTPDVAVILNVESDHPDTYLDLQSLYDTFDIFINSVKQGGAAVVCGETEYYHQKKCSSEHIISYGLEGDFTYTISDIEEYKSGYYRFTLHKKGGGSSVISLLIPGYHNIYNAAAAYAAASFFNLKEEDIIAGIEEFTGVKRRFETKGKLNGGKIVIDYAHHPSEIKAAIRTALSMKPQRVVTVFQPHTFSRTQQLYNDFVTAFKGSSELCIFKEYPARETARDGRSAFDLYNGIKAAEEIPVYYYNNIISLAEKLQGTVKKGDILLILGAGDIPMLAEILKDV